jgi:hypothetical protein
LFPDRDAFWEEDGRQNLMSEIAGKVSNKPVAGCKVVTTEEDFCWLLGDGVTACSANIECKDSMNVFVTMFLKAQQLIHVLTRTYY